MIVMRAYFQQILFILLIPAAFAGKVGELKFDFTPIDHSRSLSKKFCDISSLIPKLHQCDYHGSPCPLKMSVERSGKCQIVQFKFSPEVIASYEDKPFAKAMLIFSKNGKPIKQKINIFGTSSLVKSGTVEEQIGEICEKAIDPERWGQQGVDELVKVVIFDTVFALDQMKQVPLYPQLVEEFKYYQDWTSREPQTHGALMATRVSNNAHDVNAVIPIVSYNGQKFRDVKYCVESDCRIIRYDTYELISAIKQSKALVVNLSTHGKKERFGNGLDLAMKKNPNTLFVAAAGNIDDDLTNDDIMSNHYPQKLAPDKENLVLVAAWDREKNQLVESSATHPQKVDFALSTPFPEQQTSVAAAITSRVVSKLVKKYPQFTGPQIKEALCETVTPVEELVDLTRCGGTINPKAADLYLEKMKGI